MEEPTWQRKQPQGCSPIGQLAGKKPPIRERSRRCRGQIPDGTGLKPCQTWLNKYNTGDLCAPCEKREKGLRKARRSHRD